MRKIYILWGTLKVWVKWHGHIIWLFHFLSTFPHSTAATPTTMFCNTWVKKNRNKAPCEILNLLYENLPCFFRFEQLQMLVDGAWEKDNIKTTECVCKHVRLVLLSLDWLWKSADFRSYSVTDCSTTSSLQFIWQVVLFLVLSQALNIHCNNVCFYFVQIINTIYPPPKMLNIYSSDFCLYHFI